MNILDTLHQFLWDVQDKVERFRLKSRWEYLRSKRMRLGTDVWLPRSTWIDPDYCHLITIGDHCGFGEECLILAHDAQMDEFLDAARIGRVEIHESCHIGARTTILPGVEIGPRTIVGANSLVCASLPPDTVCAGNPARVICTLEHYLAKHRLKLAQNPTFSYENVNLSPDMCDRMVESTKDRCAYVTGGRSAELRGEGGTPRTPPNPYSYDDYDASGCEVESWVTERSLQCAAELRNPPLSNSM